MLEIRVITRNVTRRDAAGAKFILRFSRFSLCRIDVVNYISWSKTDARHFASLRRALAMYPLQDVCKHPLPQLL
ncbi:hypothetical protein HanRHA438_Chr14g0655311 [Helianthus annuus]|nr:hypothetical protein HanRHA438_Chr14g0655311 [Helianthus annuus]